MVSQIHHSPHTRTRIVWRYNSGISATRIARDEGVSRHAIYGIVRRYRDQQSGQDQPKPGRPRKIGDREKRHIIRIISQDSHIQIQELIEKANLNCCKQTLVTFLRKEGIMHYKSLLRPLLSEETARKRLRFARRYVHMSTDFWEKWTFSDEVAVARGEGQRRTWCFSRETIQKERTDPCNTDKAFTDVLQCLQLSQTASNVPSLRGSRIRTRRRYSASSA